MNWVLVFLAVCEVELVPGGKLLVFLFAATAFFAGVSGPVGLESVVSPLTANSSATARKLFNESCATLTSP